MTTDTVIPRSSTILTRELTLSTLRDIIADAEGGADHVYEKQTIADDLFGSREVCAYRVEGEPSCIVGHLISRLYPEQFAALGGIVDGYLVGPVADKTSIRIIGSEKYRDETPILAEGAHLAGEIRGLQSAQDRTSTWGEAFQLAFGEPV